MVAGVAGVIASGGALGAVAIPFIGGAAGTSITIGTGGAVVVTTTGVVSIGAEIGAVAGTVGTAAGILSGPVGWAILGTTQELSSALYTFDCWKSVLHDQSTEPSNGRILREVAADPCIKEITIASNDNNVDLPHLVLKNIWDEEFRIDYVYLPSIGLAAHAVRI